MLSRHRQLIFLHSSDELYGADRMLLEIVGAASRDSDVQVWLPNDLAHPSAPLCQELITRGVAVRHLHLPILRRAYQNPRGIAALLGKSARLLRELRSSQPDAVYCTTSAVLLAAPLARLARTPEVVVHFLVASRWNGWKGHRTLLATWDLAGSPGRLVILGGPPPSGESVDVRALVAGLTSPDSVSVVGEDTDPSGYLQAADVVVMPSDRPEPFGLVAIEAFARGRPVIASAAGGLLEIVTPEENGWLFTPGDPQALATVLAGLTRDAVTAAGARARKSYLERFTVRRFVDRWRAAVPGDRLRKR